MGRISASVSIVLLLCAAPPALAQHQEVTPLDLTPSGEAYLEATRFRGIEQEVLYFDPTRPPPPLETTQEIPEEQDADLDLAFANRNEVMIIAGAILLLLLYFAFVGRGNFSVSFARDPKSEERGRTILKSQPKAPGVPAGLDAILAMADRRDALVALCRSVLARVMNEEGVLPNNSWTDRDTLRRVPQSHPSRAALRDLIYASERVQFGGRDVTEDEFNAHVERLTPLWRGRSA